MIGNLERNADELKGIIKVSEWNSVHLIARGNMITKILNGHVTTTSWTTTRRPAR